MRKYKSGSKWALWRWTETPSGYITRLHVLMTPWFAICLHWISTPDKEPWNHDHPVSFLSIILRGWYVEKRTYKREAYGFTLRSQPRIYVRKWFNFIRASEYETHRIVLTQKRTLTLCFMSGKKREWGFHTDKGWIGWKAYNELTYEKYNKILKKYYTPEYLEQLAAMPSVTSGFFKVSRENFVKAIRYPDVPSVADYESYELTDESKT